MAVHRARGDAMGHREFTFPWRIDLTSPDKNVYSEEVQLRNNCNIRLRAQMSGSKYLIFGDLRATPTKRSKLVYRLGVLDQRGKEKICITNICVMEEVRSYFIGCFDREDIKYYLIAENGFKMQCSFGVVGDIEEALERLSALSAT